MTIYLSGPISNTPDYAARFEAAERKLAGDGHRVINPARFFMPGWTWQQYMRRDLNWLKGCDAIHMLEGWQQSPGARVELIHALGRGLRWIR